ncbi:single-stranded-DNA-specific exonuclease RecJ [Inconstantimicrobium mannanitabidum]|uniref:Single-stranded-DNA-specific exonuclease RecJ n=1 Tax=Inconstantimicrobium mannanitabidum TaxID=1604901 RepID=A0ACB5R8K3_9CLOT|nr:single-stranded-DNA-specific exonuclease RecJ [Clostridium sp. TW13]GKX65440.1 single-stranded-DNA-specific exonuclease RecJ [Clostridium sp. TW13]
MQEQWFLINRKDEKTSIENLINELDVDYYTAKLLVNRGIEEIGEAKKFLNPTIANFYSETLMKDMERGVEIICNAIKSGKKIIVYGDYDCDGVISTVVLTKALKQLNANFNYHIPDRESEGYGMNIDRIKKLKEEGYEVILTCDNGIAAFEEINLAKSLGMQVVVTDHHEIPAFEENNTLVRRMPEADAIIDIKREDCPYPFKNLCGAGIALKFIICLYNKFDIDDEQWINLIQYVAIATVCDVVDLKEENRDIVSYGLKKIMSTENLGLKALIEETGLKDKVISVTHLGFVIGPCINATGRLENAKLSVDLFLSETEEEAKALAKKLVELNKERQELTTESTENVIEEIEKSNMSKDKVLLIYSPNIHESIAGIVAGRIKEKYYRPTIIMTKGKEMPKGSGRSIDEYNIFEELSRCKEYISKFGGHPMAAGLSVEEEKLHLVREALLRNCALTKEDLMPKQRIDFRLSVDKINENIIENFEKIKPYGKGNPAPLCAEKGLEISRVWILGKDRNVIKFRVNIPNSYKTIDAIGFGNIIDRFKESFEEKYGNERLIEVLESTYGNFNMDFIYVPKVNEYNGNKNIQLEIKSLRL